MRIKLFGIAKDIIKTPSIEIAEDGINTVAELKNRLHIFYPDLTGLHSFAVAVNHEYATDEQEIHPDSEIALIPPVSGG